MSNPSHSIFPLPAPLHRLNVRDSLIINADRWLTSERYQRDRQNLQFQAINQSGIVCGLGVKILTKADLPKEIQSRSNNIWIEIQPGMAIDPHGNPIIVDSGLPRLDRIYSIDLNQLVGRDRLTIYVTLSYVEPIQPTTAQDETLRELFRVDRLSQPPTAHQLELCRIELTQESIPQLPQDVLVPRLQELNLCHRPQAHPRSQGRIRAAQVQLSQEPDLATSKSYEEHRENLAELMDSVFSLYPALEGEPNIETINLSDQKWNSSNLDFDLLHIPNQQDLLDSIHEPRYADKCFILKQYLQSGGTILLETESLSKVEGFLEQLRLQSLKAWRSTPDILIDPRHPLRRKPFLFAALPGFQQLYYQDGIVMIEGNLSTAWNVTKKADQSRTEIRAAQEFGINILHLAWQRRRLTQLMHW